MDKPRRRGRIFKSPYGVKNDGTPIVSRGDLPEGLSFVPLEAKRRAFDELVDSVSAPVRRTDEQNCRID